MRTLENSNIKMFRLLIFSLFIFQNFIGFSQTNPETLFKKANDAYQRNDYIGAIDNYNELLKMDIHSTEVYYNLGNTHYKKKELSKAILNYERALKLSPNDADVLHNLKLAQAQTADEIETLPEFFLTQIWKDGQSLATSGTWSVIGILVLWLGISGIIFWLVGNSRQAKKWGFFGGLVAVLLSLIPFGLAFSKSSFEKNSRQAIIMETRASLRSAPDAESSRIIELHEGTKVELLDEIGEWHQVKLADGELGWLEKGKIEEI